MALPTTRFRPARWIPNVQSLKALNLKDGACILLGASDAERIALHAVQR